MRQLIKKILGKHSLEEQVKKLKEGGAYIGTDVHFYDSKLEIDTQFPFMLHIGNHVEITANVTILNHDYSWSVIKCLKGNLIGGVGPVFIGDNCFIGTKSTILMNTNIGNNCIVGAGSVVFGKFPDNSVIAGVPARVICTLDDYIEKRDKRQYSEAAEIVRHYRRAFNKNPTKDKLPAYFWLFESRSNEIEESIYIQRMQLKGNYEESLKLFKNSKPMFKSFEDFLNSID